MADSRLTEERLRSWLDSSQMQRERMCLALLPILGDYSGAQPRRPKGGPDGARDIEARYRGSLVVWGAVGFQNGGGNDKDARREAQKKYEEDLDNALSESPELKGFVFFTNVDLTPGIVADLKKVATDKGISWVDIFDMERLRDALDSPEGMISRLQYLDIEMTKTEQLALVNRFGGQLQQVVTSRFDRVERTLQGMERFLAFQRPVNRIDIYVDLVQPTTPEQLGQEAVLIHIGGLFPNKDSLLITCISIPNHVHATDRLICRSLGWLVPHTWNAATSQSPIDSEKATDFMQSASNSLSQLVAYCPITLTANNHKVSLSQVDSISTTIHMTSSFTQKANRISIDINGYEILSCPVMEIAKEVIPDFPAEVAAPKHLGKWKIITKNSQRNFHFDPPQSSGRHVRLADLPPS